MKDDNNTLNKRNIYTEKSEFLDLVEDETAVYDAKRDFTSLKAWKKARKVKLFFYESILPVLPQEEKYHLEGQIRDAAVSSTANIAEGYGRYHYQENIQFCRVSRGSLFELKDHLISCKDFNYIDNNLFNDGLNMIEEALKTLNGYINYLISQKKKTRK